MINTAILYSAQSHRIERVRMRTQDADIDVGLPEGLLLLRVRGDHLAIYVPRIYEVVDGRVREKQLGNQ